MTTTTYHEFKPKTEQERAKPWALDKCAICGNARAFVLHDDHWRGSKVYDQIVPTPTPATTQERDAWATDHGDECQCANCQIKRVPGATQEQRTATPNASNIWSDLEADRIYRLSYSERTPQEQNFLDKWRIQKAQAQPSIAELKQQNEKLVAALRQIRDHISAAFESDGEEFVSENDLLNWCDDALAEVQEG